MKRFGIPVLLTAVLLVWLAAVPSALAQYDEHGDHMASSAAEAAGTQGSIDKLVGQIRVAITHAGFSLNQSEISPRHLHAHHVVNILQGVHGPNFDASKGNPGDGYGALNYAKEVARTDVTRVWADNAELYLTWAAAAAVEATQTADFAAAGEAIHRSLAFLSAALGRPDDVGMLGAALASQASTPKIVTVEITNFVFGDGKDLVIPVGTTVVWVNRDSAPHTVTGGPLASPVLNRGDAFTYTFTEATDFEYICAFHPEMRQRIIVQ